MIKLTQVFQERVERGMRFREYFYISLLVVFSAYQFSEIGGSPSRFEILIYFILVPVSMVCDRLILLYIKKGYGTDWFTFFSVGKDILLLTYLLHLTGGIESPFIFLYFLIAIGVAAAMGFVYGLSALIAICISFFALVYLEFADLINHHSQKYFQYILLNYKNFYLLLMVTGEIFLLGTLSVYSNRYIARRLRMRERELSDTVEKLSGVNKLLEKTNMELIELSSQIELQKENLERSNRLQKTLYNVTTHFVEHFTIDTMIKKIHNEISNIMPVLSCSLVLKKKGSEEVEIVPSSEDITGNKNVTDIFNRAIELNDSYITDEYIAIPVKIVEDNQSVLICYKDPQSRQLREEEIRIIYSVSRLIGMFIDRFELFQKLQYLSNTDGLTGLHNHRFFHTRLEEEVARSSRSGRPLSLLIMDMDNFKEVNDRFGHQEGDRVLSHIAGILKDAFRHSDVIARYGGDEFAGILPETDVNSALNIAKRVSDKIKNTEITVAKEKIKLTLCTGIASISGEEVISSREIVSRADTALYNAKKTGSGTIKVF